MASDDPFADFNSPDDASLGIDHEALAGDVVDDDATQFIDAEDDGDINPLDGVDVDGGDDGDDDDLLGSSSAPVEEPARAEPTEPTALSIWKAKRRVELQERRDDERRKKTEAEDAARQEISEFLAKRKADIARRQAENREEEKHAQSELDTLKESGTTWQRVAQMVNLQPKTKNLDPKAKKAITQREQAKNSTDRMRTLMIELKNEKP